MSQDTVEISEQEQRLLDVQNRLMMINMKNSFLNNNQKFQGENQFLEQENEILKEKIQLLENQEEQYEQIIERLKEQVQKESLRRREFQDQFEKYKKLCNQGRILKIQDYEIFCHQNWKEKVKVSGEKIVELIKGFKLTIQSMRINFDRLKKKINIQLEQKNNELQELYMSQSHLTFTVQKLDQNNDQNIEELREEISQLKFKIKQKEQELLLQQTQLAELDQVYKDNQEKRQKQYQKQLRDHMSENQILSKQMQLMKKQKKENDEKIHNFQQETKELREQNSDLRNRLDSLLRILDKNQLKKSTFNN